ncbi:MAG: helix-turn-helix domain-containing protein [Candidatus Micrarchaeota archaeon]|nr:helix-turn-helix domain-containing protein [Candidatus Micrarchaeota archaeon]MCX8154707.1 helix-turn-helix domain-containing protein [Candidatus Micrarchaeota archaeon]
MNIEDVKNIIAGDIIFSSNVGETLKKWREIFGFRQKEIASVMKINQSMLSDYENSRRRNPNISFIRRFIDALIELDMMKGGEILKKIANFNKHDYFERKNFSKGITIQEFVDIIDGKVIVDAGDKNSIIYGYTIVDSIRVILDMPEDDFPLLYGGIPDRAMIFLGVSTGRSPMVVIRIAPIKPKVVVFMNLETVDELAKEIAKRQRIPIISTNLSIAELKERLAKI